MPDQTTLDEIVAAIDESGNSDEEFSKDLLLEAVQQYFEQTDDLDDQVEALNALREQRLHLVVEVVRLLEVLLDRLQQQVL